MKTVTLALLTHFAHSTLVTTAVAVPATTELTLSGTGDDNTLVVRVDPGIASSEDTTTLSGSVIVDLDVNPNTGGVSSIGLRDGRVSGTDMNFSAGFGTFGYNFDVRNLSGAVFTPDPPQPVTPSTGDFDASLHSFNIDQGTITGAAFGQPLSENFANEPASGSGDGTGNLVLTESATSELYVTFDVVLSLPVAVDDSLRILNNSATVTLTANGTIRATGTIDVPKSAYIAWTIDEGIDGADAAADANADGIPNALAWAAGFNAVADATALMPRAMADGSFTFNVPVARTGINLQASTDLAAWMPVASDRISSLSNPLPPGTSGTVTIDASGKPAEFLRLQVNP